MFSKVVNSNNFETFCFDCHIPTTVQPVISDPVTSGPPYPDNLFK